MRVVQVEEMLGGRCMVEAWCRWEHDGGG